MPDLIFYNASFQTNNKNIEEEVKAKLFREDLYYKLNVVSLLVKPLPKNIDERN
jgi:DNA-binding NtrC family response regulator